MKLGTNERFNLVRTPYARRGSVMYIYEDFYKKGQLHLGCHKSGDMISGTDFMFDIYMLVNGAPVKYEYFADEGSLILSHGGAFVEFAHTDRQLVRVRGKGAGVKLVFNSTTAGNGARGMRGAFPVDGGWEADCGKYGKVFFKAAAGALYTDFRWNDEKNICAEASFTFLPDASTGSFDGAVHEYDGEMYDYGWYEPFDQLVADNKADFSSFKAKYKGVAKGYEETADYAIWTIWNHRVNPRGQIKEPVMFLHHQWAIVGASWQQSYNAMPTQADLKEAWRLICTMFLYQDERTGRLPGMLSYNGQVSGMQPPFQGFALDFLIRNVGDDFISPEEARKMYPKFAKWVDYWTTYRSAGYGNDVTIMLSPHESGWDDASNFQDGFPAEDPNNMAFLVLLMENTALLARKAGKPEESEAWYARAKKLLDIIVNDYWDGEKFVTKVRGKPVDALSLSCYQPIILGKRLPQNIIDKVAEKVMEPGAFLTEIGLASESMRSPRVTFGISFVCGRVVAPQNMIMSVGLHSAGKTEEAAEVARRYCDNVKKEGIILGFAPYDYYPLTGEKADMQIPPIATDGWPWNSWCANCFMTMAGYII